MKISLPLCFYLLATLALYAQERDSLLQSRKSSFYTYIYQISSEDALAYTRKKADPTPVAYHYLQGVLHTGEKYYTAPSVVKSKKKAKKEPILDLHRILRAGKLVDSFPTHEKFERDLAHGYYLFVFAYEHELKTEMEIIAPHQVHILNNETDFQAVVLDEAGKPLTDANVHLKNRKIPFNKHSQTYKINKSNQKGLLTVTHGGFSTYQHINRKHNNPRIRRIGNRILWFPPIRLITYPVRVLVKWTKDIVHSIKRREPQGFVYGIFRLFDKENYDKRSRYNRRYWKNQKKSYLVLNQPMYRPKDTVRLKGVVLDGEGNPYQKPLRLMLERNYNDIVQLAVLKPNDLGAYVFEFALVDSLKLKLGGGSNYNKSYKLTLEEVKTKKNDDRYDDWDEPVAKVYFQYEDYELKNNSYSLKMKVAGKTLEATKSTVYNNILPILQSNEPLELWAQGKDVNGMNVLDARLLLYFTTNSVNAITPKNMLVKDTLWKKDMTLDPLGKTKIVLPEGVLPEASMPIHVRAIFTNSNQERVELFMEFQYLNVEEKQPIVQFELSEDSLFIKPKRAGAGKEGVLLIEIGTHKQLIRKKITLPHTEKINPLANYYTLKQGKEEVFCKDYEEATSQLMPYSKRDKDSVWIGMSNPRKLEFWYTIYNKNKVVKRGKDTHLAYKNTANPKESYALSLQYIWKGKTKTENYYLNFEDYDLNVEVAQPATVYPGQKTNIDIFVKDAKGKPVADADLTAYALTSKFQKNDVPELPKYTKFKKGRRSYNSFTKVETLLPKHHANLNWNEYKKAFGLSNLEFYKMFYPETGRYEHYIKTNDTIAEIGVYATSSQGFQQIHWIDIDDYPAYFAPAGAGKPYSLPIAQGGHTIKFRTANHTVEVKHVFVVKGTKLILSINTDRKQDKYEGYFIDKAPDTYTNTEKYKISRHLMPYQNSLSGLTYLKQAGTFQVLLPTQGDIAYLYPLKPHLTEIHNLNTKDQKTSFKFLFEPTFQYQLPIYHDANTIKMYEWKAQILDMPLVPLYSFAPHNFADRVESQEAVTRSWQHTLPALKTKQYLPSRVSYLGGDCHVVIIPIDSLKKYAPLYAYCAIESEKLDVFRIYSVEENKFMHLPAGKFRVFWITEKGDYITQKFETTTPHSTLFITLPAMHAPAPADSLTQRILLKYKSVLEEKHNAVERVYEYREASYNRHAYTITGKVTDATGGGLPGVGILIVGTNFGTSTDIDGFYRLNAPIDAILKFTFVGYEDVEASARGASQINITMQEGRALESVVVTGYRELERQTFTGSSAYISTKHINQIPIASFDQMLQGRTSGILIESGQGRPGASSAVVIRGAGSINQGTEPLYIIDGIAITAADFAKLNVDELESITVLKDPEATALYGSRGANGVISISTKKQTGSLAKNLKRPEEVFSESTLLPQGNNSLRRNFSDYAYWKPRLRTDRAGKASFEVTFPDDITKWETVVLAHTAYKQTGKHTSSIKSLKSLVGELAIPRFLVLGDTVRVLGKVLNYTLDSLNVKTAFNINGKVSKTAQYDKMRHSVIDSLAIVATKTDRDSLRVQYEIETSTGYRDGEIRDIPLYPQGSEEVKGQFFALYKDTTLTLDIQPELSDVQIYAYTQKLDWILGESQKLREYKHYCNEQLASKIKGILAERKIKKHLKKPLDNPKEIQNHINELCKRQKDDGQWGWWQDSAPTPWITLHVLKVLAEAKEQGFETPVKSMDMLVQMLRFELQRLDWGFDEMVEKILILQKLQQNVELKPLIVHWSDSTKHKKLSLTQKFKLWQFEVKDAPKKVLDSLLKYEQKTTFGNTYFHKPQYDLYDNHVQATLLAYQMLKSIGGQASRLEKIQNFFVGERDAFAPRNTYEMACVMDVILPDMLLNGDTLNPTSMRLEGLVNKNVTNFPYTLVQKQAGKLIIHKKGSYPLYLSISQRKWNPAPQKEEAHFKIATQFTERELVAGKPNVLMTKVEVFKKSEYTMIEIPIPAGCSYQNKDRFWENYEVYREYFREKVCIYCQHLPVGTYTYRVSLLPRYTGNYTLNPAKAEMMYFPTFFGRNESKRVEIQDAKKD